jgi:hypothetical protein
VLVQTPQERSDLPLQLLSVRVQILRAFARNITKNPSKSRESLLDDAVRETKWDSMPLVLGALGFVVLLFRRPLIESVGSVEPVAIGAAVSGGVVALLTSIHVETIHRDLAASIERIDITTYLSASSQRSFFIFKAMSWGMLLLLAGLSPIMA